MAYKYKISVNPKGERYVCMGKYPQNLVKDSNIINALGGFKSDEWTSFGYFVEGNMRNKMYFKDVDYNDERYRGVCIKAYRPSNLDSNNKKFVQAENEYKLDTPYWFKYEDIKWSIYGNYNENILLISKYILDSLFYSSLCNNYEESFLRDWLNNDFINTAFSDAEKDLLEIVKVNNGLDSTTDYTNDFLSQDTYDKVYTLSASDLKSLYYINNLKIKTGTDYAYIQGLLDYSQFSSIKKNSWWLRTPDREHEMHVCVVNHFGSIMHERVTSTYVGIVPTIQIKKQLIE